MAGVMDSLLVKLNTVGLAKKDQKLYDFLKLLVGGVGQVESSVTVISSGGGGGSGVTGSGTAGTVTQWNTSTSLTDVSQAGISAALDLLP